MPCMGGWAVRVLDLLSLDKLAIELVAGVDAADRPSPGASATEHTDPTPRLHGELSCRPLALRRADDHDR